MPISLYVHHLTALALAPLQLAGKDAGKPAMILLIRFGQNCTYAPYMTACLVISMLKVTMKIPEGVNGANVLKCDFFDSNHVWMI
jgi:hypothetical protein